MALPGAVSPAIARFTALDAAPSAAVEETGGDQLLAYRDAPGASPGPNEEGNS
jgi:hypothetical protein